MAMLSDAEKIMFLREVPFFVDLDFEHLQLIAALCEEVTFAADEMIIQQEHPGGTLFVIINGRVGVEQEKRPGHISRIATLAPSGYVGEMTLFDRSAYSVSAIAIEDTFALRLDHTPFMALAQDHADLALTFVGILTNLLRSANDRIAELTRPRPRELQRFYDHI